MNIRKITEDEVRSLWVQRLPDTPNRAGRFGTPGMSAAEIKAAYDALGLRIVERYNELVDAVLAGELASTLKTGNGEDTLADFFADIKSGALAAYLTVDGERALSTLAAAFDCHDHEGEYAPLINGKIDATYLPDKYESVFAEAEADRASAEDERRAAEREREAEEEERRINEARREALIEAFRETVAEIEEREAERGERVLLALEASQTARAESLAAAAAVKRLGGEVSNLRSAAEGILYKESEDARSIYRKDVPSGAMPYAAIAAIGGGYHGATAIEIPDAISLTDIYDKITGHSEGGILCQTGNPGPGAAWRGIPLVLEGGLTYTVGFEVYVDPAIPVNNSGDYSFGITREKQRLLLYSVTCPARGEWVRKSITFQAPSRLSEDGYLPSTGDLFLGYTGSMTLVGEGIRFRNVSVTRGTAAQHVERDGAAGVPVTSVLSHGKNLVPTDYPALHSSLFGVTSEVLPDGDILLNGVAERNISLSLYTETDDLALPEGEISIASDVTPNVTLILKTGADERFKYSATVMREDEYYGHYYLYLYIPEGTVLENVRVRPFLCRGNAKTPVPYHAPYRLEIPESVRALPGYGLAGNTLDFAEGVYRQTVDENGAALPSEVTTPLPASLCDACLLPVEEGGFLTFENENSEAVASTVLYEIKS